MTILSGCGEFCSRCNWVWGCEQCPGDDQNKGYKNVTSKYKNYALQTASNFDLTFYECQKCTKSRECWECQNDDADICTSCNYPFNDQSALNTQCRQDYVGNTVVNPNCLIFNKNNDGDCLYCKDGYYLQSTNDASYGSINKCIPKCGNNTLYNELVRCEAAKVRYSRTGRVQITGMTGCRDSYLDPNTKKCLTNCGVGRYGSVTYNALSGVESSTCSACHSSCYECTGPSSFECTSCKKGNYLNAPTQSLNGGKPSTVGRCIPKIAGNYVYTIYVNKARDDNSRLPSDTVDGSYGNAFNTLIDAINYAYHLGAPWTSANITILLKDGIHALAKRNSPRRIVFPPYRDPHSQTTRININSESGDQILLNYKLRDSWAFPVGAGLTIRNLIFDASDSGMVNYTQETVCTYDESPSCCSTNDNNNNYTMQGNEAGCYNQELLTEECHIADNGAAFFKFDITDRTMLSTPPTLTLENVEFKNFFYDFSSFIELNDFGGHVVLRNVTAYDFNSCGSFIRKKTEALYKVTGLVSTQFDTLYQLRMNNLQYQLYAQEQQYLSGLNPYQSTCSDNPESTGRATCYSLTITSSIFRRFGWAKPKLNHGVWVNPSYNMKNYGTVIDLDGFKGNVAIIGTTFDSNVVRYESCDVADGMDARVKGFTDKYPNYGPKLDLQMKAAISIINHAYHFDFVQNTVQSNIGTKGIIYLDFKPRSTFRTRVLFQSNTFENNAGYLDASTIFIRMRGFSGKSVYDTIPNNNNLFCTGIHMSNNIFFNNYGCFTKVGGVIKAECVDYDQLQYYNNDRYNYRTISASDADNYYNINLAQHTTSLSTVVYSGVSYSIDLNKNLFTNNNFTQNYASGGHSLLEFVGLPRIFLSNEYFKDNGESTQEIINTLGQSALYLNKSSKYQTFDLVTNNDTFYDYTKLSTGLIKVQRCSQLNMYSLTFDSNWMLETGFSLYRAHLLVLKEMYGEWDMQRMNVQNIYGMKINSLQTAINPLYTYLTPLEQRGTKFPLFQCYYNDKVKHTNHIKGPNTFKNLRFYEDTGNTNTMFFYTMKSEVEDYDAYNGYFLTDTLFERVDCLNCTRAMIQISSLNTTISNTTFNQLNIQNKQNNWNMPQNGPTILFKIKKPYTQRSGGFSSTAYTEYLTLQNSYATDNYFGSGRLMQIQYQYSLNEIDPTINQINFVNMTFDNNIITNGGGLIYVDINKIRMNVATSSFNSMYAGDTTQLYAQKGGYFYVKSASYLGFQKITADSIYTNYNATFGGGGRFLYYDTDGTGLTLNITDSDISCDPDPLSSSSISSRMAARTFNQGSAFQLDARGTIFTLLVNNSDFYNCHFASQGGAFGILADSHLSSMSFYNSRFHDNVAQNGGAIYCDGCDLLLYNNTFDSNSAYMGGDLYLKDPIDSASQILDSNQHSNSEAYYQGGSVYAEADSSSLDLTLNSTISTKKQQFTSISAAHSGGIFYFNLTNISISINNIIASSSFCGQYGGFLMFANLQDFLYLDIINSTFTNIFSQNSLGGFIWTPTSLGVGNVQLINSTFDRLKGNGGNTSIILQSFSDMNIDITNCTFSNSNSDQDGLFYINSDVVNLNLLNSVLTDQYSSSKNGGIFNIESTGTVSVDVAKTNISNSRSLQDGGSFSIKAQDIDFNIRSNSRITTSRAANGGFIAANITHTSGAFDLLVTNSTISSTTATASGGFAVVYGNGLVTTSTISAATILNTKAQYGGLMRIYGKNNEVNLAQASITNSSSTLDGGLLYFSSNSLSNTININSNTSIQDLSSDNGGLLHLNGISHTVNLQNATFRNIQANQNGGAIFVNDLTTTDFNLLADGINGAGFISRNQGSFIKFESALAPQVNITIQKSTLACQLNDMFYNFPNNYLDIVDNLYLSSQQIGGMFYLRNLSAGTLVSTNNTFKNCYTTKQGSIFYLDMIDLTDTNSSYLMNAGLQGVIYSSRNQVYLQETTFKDSLAINGSVMFLSNGANATFDSVTMSNGKAMISGGAIMAQGTQASSIRLINCKSTNLYFQAGYNGGFINIENPLFQYESINCNWNHLFAGNAGGFLSGSMFKNFSIFTCNIQNISTAADGRFIQVLSPTYELRVAHCNFSCLTTTSISSSFLTDLDALTVSTSLQVVSLFTIENVEKFYSESNFFTDCRSAKYGSIFRLKNTSLIDSNSYYARNAAIYGGSLYLNSSNATLTNVTFDTSMAQYGGTISFDNSANVLFDNVKVFNSTATQQGGFLYIQDTSGLKSVTIIIQNSNFTKLKAFKDGGAFYLDAAQSNLQVENIYLDDTTALQRGGFAFINKVNQFFVRRSQLTNLVSYQNGSIMASYAPVTILLQQNIFDCMPQPQYSVYNLASNIASLTRGTPFYFINSVQIDSVGNTFQNCFSSSTGGVFSVINTFLNDTGGTKFINNSANQGGAVYCKNCTVNMYQTEITRQAANYGGIIYLHDGGTIILDTIVVNNAYAQLYGGSIASLVTSTGVTATVTVVNVVTVYNTSAYDGGFLYSENTLLSVSLSQGFTLDYSYARNNGGAFHINKLASILIGEAILYNFAAAVEGSFMYTNSSSKSITFRNSLFHSRQDPSLQIFATNNYGSAIYIKSNGLQTTSINNTFQDCLFYGNGGVFSIMSANLSDSDSRYLNNAANKGGSIYCDQCVLILNNITFTDGSSYDSGGTFYLVNYQYLSFVGVTVQNSSTTGKGGSYYLTGTVSMPLLFQNLQINQSYSDGFGGVFYIDNPNLQLTLRNMTITNFGSRLSSGGGIKVASARNISIEQSFFQNFTSPVYGSLLHTDFAGVSVYLTNNVIQCNHRAWTFADIDQKLNVQPPVYDHDKSGAIYISNSPLIQSITNTYQYCYVSYIGGIFTIYSSDIFTDESSIFSDNAAMYGATIFADGLDIKLTNTQFENNYGFRGGALYLNNSSPANLTNITFLDNQAYVAGGAIYLVEPIDEDTWVYNSANAYQFYINDTTFTNHSVQSKGGCIYIDSPSISLLKITKTSFLTASSNDQGGIFYIKSFGGLMQLIKDTSGSINNFLDFAAETDGSLLYSIASNFSLQIEENVIECKEDFVSYVNISTLNLTDVQGGAFYIENAENTINSYKNNYSHCMSTTFGGVYTLSNTQFTELESYYFQNSARKAGAIFCTSCVMSITKTIFEYNTAEDGGVFLIDNDSNVTIGNVTITKNYAMRYGGVMNLRQSNIIFNQKSTIELANSTLLSDNKADSQGGFFYLQNKYASLEIKSCSFSSHNAPQGGMFQVEDIDQLTISKGDMSSFYSPTSAFMHAVSTNMRLRILNSNFRCQPLVTQNDLVANLNLTKPKTAQFITNIFIQNAISTYSRGNNYQSCGIAETGGVYKLKDTNFTDDSSTYTRNSANTGGVFYCLGCGMELINTRLYQNYAHRGAAISLDSSGYMRAYKVTFQANYAYYSCGAILASSSSHFIAEWCEFLENYSVENSVLEFQGTSQNANITLSGCLFKQNIADKNSFSFMYSNVVIRQSTFTDNLSNYRTKNIFGGFSNIYIYGSTFENTQASAKDETQQNLKTQGTYIYLIFGVNIYIYDSKFKNGFAKDGGAIFQSGDSSIYIYNTLFQNNIANQNGGAIYADNFLNLVISDNSRFFDNTAFKMGDDLLVGSIGGYFEMSNSSVRNPSAKTCVYAEMINLVFYNMSFTDSYNTKSQKGAALQCLNCRSMIVNASSFNSLRSQLGGAIYIEETERNKKSTDRKGKYQIINSRFTNNSAQMGGAIYLANNQFVTVSKGFFQKNKAFYVPNEYVLSGSGGSIFYHCELGSNCFLEVINSTTFDTNSADIQGGVMYWDETEPKMENSTIYTRNKATQYGNNLACYAQDIMIINGTTYAEKLEDIGYDEYAFRMLQEQRFDLEPLLSFKEEAPIRQMQEMNANQTVTQKSGVSYQRSGGLLPTIYIAHIDKYGEIVGSDFKSRIKVELDLSAINDKNALAYTPFIEGTIMYTSVGGMVKINNVSVTGSPGYAYGLQFSTNGIDMTKQTNKDYYKAKKKNETQFNISVSLRECEIGEQFTTLGKCVQCPEGQSFSTVKMKSPGNCESCPKSKSFCFGGAFIGPKEGYWRKDNVTTNFQKCPYEKACLGMVAPEYNPMGECAEGYQGVMCGDCQKGYSRSNDFQCSKCPDEGPNIIRITFILIAAVVILSYLVRSTLTGAKNVNNVTSIYQKILLNHIQLILLTASFNFEWPEILLDFFDFAKPVAAVSDQLFSFDCFLDANFNSNSSIRIIYIKFIMYASVPFILAIISSGFWYTYRCLKKFRIEVKNKVMSTLVILLFLVHPNIVIFMFYNFKCIDVDGENRLLRDLQVMCYSDMHNLFSYAVVIPSIVVWGLGIPFFALILLFKIRTRLHTLQAKESLGFLFRGYRKDFYFWEIVIMYRKIALIFISVFLSVFGVMAQALVVFLILIMFLIVNNKKKPFSTIPLNDLETLSLVTSMISIYCGLFFISNKPEEWIKANPQYAIGSLTLADATKLVFFAVIIIANGVFFVYWTYKMYQEVVSKLRVMLPKLYICLFLCGNKEKYFKEIEDQRIKQENEILREDFFKQLRSMKDMYYSKEITLNDNKLEKFKKHTHKLVILDLMADKKTREQIQDELKQLKRLERKKFNKGTPDPLLNPKNYKIYPAGQISKNTINSEFNLKEEVSSFEKDKNQISTQQADDRKNYYRADWDLNISNSIIKDQSVNHRRNESDQVKSIKEQPWDFDVDLAFKIQQQQPNKQLSMKSNAAKENKRKTAMQFYKHGFLSMRSSSDRVPTKVSNSEDELDTQSNRGEEETGDRDPTEFLRTKTLGQTKQNLYTQEEKKTEFSPVKDFHDKLRQMIQQTKDKEEIKQQEDAIQIQKKGHKIERKKDKQKRQPSLNGLFKDLMKGRFGKQKTLEKQQVKDEKYFDKNEEKLLEIDIDAHENIEISVEQKQQEEHQSLRLDTSGGRSEKLISEFSINMNDREPQVVNDHNQEDLHVSEFNSLNSMDFKSSNHLAQQDNDNLIQDELEQMFDDLDIDNQSSLSGGDYDQNDLNSQRRMMEKIQKRQERKIQKLRAQRVMLQQKFGMYDAKNELDPDKVVVLVKQNSKEK